MSKNEKISFAVKVSKLGQKLVILSKENDVLKEKMLSLFVYQSKEKEEASSL